jgi:hypothetical protein
LIILDVSEVLTQSIGMDNIERFDAMQDRIHDGYHIGERLLSLA